MSELKLLKCPFCGGEAEMLNYSPTEWLVHCIECDGMVEKWRETEEEAIEQWNRRTPMANIVEKLEEYAKSPICDNHMYGCPYADNDNVLCENCGAYGAINIVKREIGEIENEPTNN